jgi:hypothetical protein
VADGFETKIANGFEIQGRLPPIFLQGFLAI